MRGVCRRADRKLRRQRRRVRLQRCVRGRTHQGTGPRFPAKARALDAITARIVDVLPVAREYYYHPGQHGSWSIKYVLPSMVPELDYGALNGVKDGAMASAAFLEAIRAGNHG